MSTLFATSHPPKQIPFHFSNHPFPQKPNFTFPLFSTAKIQKTQLKSSNNTTNQTQKTQVFVKESNTQRKEFSEEVDEKLEVDKKLEVEAKSQETQLKSSNNTNEIQVGVKENETQKKELSEEVEVEVEEVDEKLEVEAKSQETQLRSSNNTNKTQVGVKENETQKKDLSEEVEVDEKLEVEAKSQETQLKSFNNTRETQVGVKENETQKKDSSEEVEVDWKLDEEFKSFMGNPSIEAALKLEKKRADRKLKELDMENSSSNPIVGLFNRVVRDRLAKERERLERVEEAFKALDLNKLRSCFGFNTFFATDVRRFGDGGIFIGNLRRPIEEVMPKLEKKLSEAAGTDVVLWFMEEKTNDISKQVCMVQPKSEIDLQFELTKLSTPWGYVSSILLCVTTFGTIALMSGFFLKPDATFDDYLADVVPLFGGFLSILGVSEIATRVTAARYGVKLSPSFLVPSNWTGCLGVMNNYESLLPNKKALFDIPAARTASAYLTSLALAVAAFVADGSFNGGDNALYIRPQFFFNNPLLSFIQFVIGPYTDDLGNVLPYAVEGVGVPVDPLAFAGLLGMVVTSLNLLPCGRLEGGRIAQALFGRNTATLLSFGTSLLLGLGGLSGSVLCLAWGLFATFFRGGEEIPAKDEITPLSDDRYAWGLVLFFICLLTLFPNGGGTFSSSFFNGPFFRGEL